MGSIIHFEISADDPDRAIDFLEKTFGWKIEKWGGPMEYWLIATKKEGEPGIDGAIRRRSGNQPVTNTIDVEDLGISIEKVMNAGGEILMPRMAVPDVGWMCYIKDTEGIVHGLMQNDPAAK